MYGQSGGRTGRRVALIHRGRASARLRADAVGRHCRRSMSRESRAVRNEPVLRLFLLSALEPDDARTVLREIADNSQRQISELDQALATETPASPDGRLPFGWLAAAYGLRQYQASHDWAMWALGELDKTQASAITGERCGRTPGRSRTRR